MPIRSTVLLLLLSLAAGSNAPAYDRAGHLDTAAARARGLGDGAVSEDRILVAFCAELPDLASELEAVGVYRRTLRNPLAWAGWALSSDTGNDRVRRMVTVQQLLHALTGGRSEVVREVAAGVVEDLGKPLKGLAPGIERNEALCALGFALHLLGDSRAHEKIDDIERPAAQRRMYGTGVGHLADWHDPDRPLCTRYVDVASSSFRNCRFEPKGFRFDLWRDLWSLLAPVMESIGGPTLEDGTAKSRNVADLGPTASAANRWHEREMRQRLGEGAQAAAKGWVELAAQYEDDPQPCDKVLLEATRRNPPLLTAQALPRCAKVWDLFAAAAQARFNQPAAQEAREPLVARKPFDPAVYCANPVSGDCR